MKARRRQSPTSDAASETAPTAQESDVVALIQKDERLVEPAKRRRARPKPRPSSVSDSQPPARLVQPEGPTTMVDPLADPTEVVWYIRPPSGGQFGPATRELMKTWIAQGRVTPDSLVWREGWRDWQEAGSVFPQLSPNPTDVLPDLEDMIVEELFTPKARPSSRSRTGRSRSAAGPWWVVAIVVGLAIVTGAAVWIWVTMS
jgi:hypothetical protein